MEAPQQELYLFNKRDEVEKYRLNQQNAAANAVRGGHILDPAIQKENIFRIADIATGTGIFMGDVRAELAAAGNATPPEIVGFDISPAQFPDNPLPGTKFVVWNMIKDFPEEYHNSFDIVHIRFAVFTMPIEQIRGVVENLVKLIKPGGYLQWTDYTYRHGSESLFPDRPDGLSSLAEGKTIFAFQAEQNWAVHILGHVEDTLQSLPMEVVQVTDFSDAPFHRPEIRGLLATWHSLSVPMILELMMLRKGVDKEEIKRTTDAYRVKAQEMTKRGQIFQMTICTLVARRKSVSQHGKSIL